MSLNTFSAYREEFPVDLNDKDLREAAVQIANKKGLQFEDVLIVLEGEQNKAATRCNDDKRRNCGRGHTFTRQEEVYD